MFQNKIYQKSKCVKSRIYKITLIVFLTLHTYLLFPGMFILYKMMGSRMSPGCRANDFHFSLYGFLAIMVVSYIVIFLAIRFAFYFPKSIMFRIITISGYLILTYFLCSNYDKIYGFHAWFENTFTTEMKAYRGPCLDFWNKPYNDEISQFLSLQIWTMHPDSYERLSTVFSDLDTDDWVLTTIGMFKENSHWESNPVFLDSREHNIKRLEDFDKKKLTYLVGREIKNKSVERLFNGEDKVNSRFINYIMADSTLDDSSELKILYSMIDSLMAAK